jgi:hypothetical protein
MEEMEDGKAPTLADLNPLDFGHDMQVAVTYAQTGRSIGESRLPLALACRAMDVVRDAVHGRFALEKRRSVTPRQLAGLTGLTPTRVRQLNLDKDAEGNILPDAAEWFLRGRRVPGFFLREYDVTPSWWRGLPWDHPLRGKAEEILGQSVSGRNPSVMFSLGANTAGLSFTLQTFDQTPEPEAEQLKAQIHAKVEALLPR